jgi:cation diffusion facilitator CzcD-associated flavoprotein CzcO
VCEVFDLNKYMKFNIDVYHAEWMDMEGQWKVRCRETGPNGTVREFEDFAHILLNNSGIQNDWKWPDIEGLGLFKGKLLHTARWDPEYQAEQWKGQKVAVIGGGASSVQTVPGMQVSLRLPISVRGRPTELIQPYVKHMDVFVRTGVWFVGLGSEASENMPCKSIEKPATRAEKLERQGLIML